MIDPLSSDDDSLQDDWKHTVVKDAKLPSVKDELPGKDTIYTVIKQCNV